MDFFEFSKGTVGFFSLTLLSSGITIYIISVKKKSVPTWLLFGFFLCLTLLFAGRFLVESMEERSSEVIKHLYALSIYSLFFMMQFAFQFPRNFHVKPSKIFSFILLIVLLVLHGSIIFSDSYPSLFNGLSVFFSSLIIIVIFLIKTKL